MGFEDELEKARTHKNDASLIVFLDEGPIRIKLPHRKESWTSKGISYSGRAFEYEIAFRKCAGLLKTEFSEANLKNKFNWMEMGYYSVTIDPDRLHTSLEKAKDNASWKPLASVPARIYLPRKGIETVIRIPIYASLYAENQPDKITIIGQGIAEKFLVIYDFDSGIGDMYINMTEEEMHYYFRT